MGIALDIGAAKHSSSQFRWYQPRQGEGSNCARGGQFSTSPPASAASGRHWGGASLVQLLEIFGSLKALWTSPGDYRPKLPTIIATLRLPQRACQSCPVPVYALAHCEASSGALYRPSPYNYTLRPSLLPSSQLACCVECIADSFPPHVESAKLLRGAFLADLRPDPGRPRLGQSNSPLLCSLESSHSSPRCTRPPILVSDTSSDTHRAAFRTSTTDRTAWEGTRSALRRWLPRHLPALHPLARRSLLCPIPPTACHSPPQHTRFSDYTRPPWRRHSR